MNRTTHIKKTEREFRKQKRREFKALVKAFYNYRLGCAYCPTKTGAVGRIESALDDMAKVLRPWWRKA